MKITGAEKQLKAIEILQSMNGWTHHDIQVVFGFAKRILEESPARQSDIATCLRSLYDDEPLPQHLAHLVHEQPQQDALTMNNDSVHQSLSES